MELTEVLKLNRADKVKIELSKLIKQPNQLSIQKTDPFEELLQNENDGIQQLTIQLIAELAKTDDKRSLLTTVKIVGKLKTNLNKDNGNKELQIQTLRALGNLCFDNDEARKLISKDGLKYLIDVLDKYSKYNDAESKKLVNTAIGFLYNLLMSYEELQKVSLTYNILDVIEAILVKNLKAFEENESSITQLLFILSSVSEYLIDDWLSKGLIGLLVEILRISMNPEISALCLELLRMQSENNDIKLFLAKEKTCELVYQLVEKYGNNVDDEESRSLLKVACDLIVLILTGDESMSFLYENGKGDVYKDMIMWLNSKDVDLMSTGILAIGNFARNDSHCIQMVENGLVKTLLGILTKYTSEDANVLIQHALLSALRNLSIPLQNKNVLIDEGLVEILCKMINSEQSPVVFKLLGTLRMLVDGQEETALDLIQRKQLIEKLVYWCYNSDHLGVRGEAPRLLAWLIKNCRTSKPYTTLLSVPDSLKCLVEMISSMHSVMQNEALLALNLICLNCKDDNNLSNMFVNSDIGKHLAFIINKYYEKMENGTIENLLALIELLIAFNAVTKHLNELKVNEALKLFKNTKSITNYEKKIDKLIKSITEV